ncbi:3-hydroxyisobutyrate dehydrogenase [Parasphingorhabdus marina DSM 22363]|uniref:3-hydroxyisobutyrate dehydrogenase n=1 Tax=Parasphingorhabdus marina DSM 22363 TaxID=1123272 RepID=A0A1N6D3D4_9SPHN|nr:NAD(P)-dependent oxidoreductase [Parasphingorhabdus marina]SIN65249.1 3-hydroxyisobutyrate dehydrogenase [Parasphingorhabdus marina DSM 22363]
MSLQLSIIGFGEAARAFAPAIIGSGQTIRASDLRAEEPSYQNAFAKFGVTGAQDYRTTLDGADTVLSLVTADQALAAATEAARHIAQNAFFFDMNSVAPGTKKQAADIIVGSGGRYVDVAIMSPVEPKKATVPLLLSGPDASEGLKQLSATGFSNCKLVGEEIGRASTIKMIRSVLIKGQEALTAEMMHAARNAGVEEEVVGSLGGDWQDRVAYNLERMMTHGWRRAAEMEEVAKTLEALQVEPLMTRGTIVRQREMAESGERKCP